MLSFLPWPIIGLFNILFISINTLFWGLMIFLIAVIKYIIPLEAWRKMWTPVLDGCAQGWRYGVILMIWLTMRMHVDVHSQAELSRKEWYLLLSNHQSWVDIFIFAQVFTYRTPPMVFFIKKELLKLPIIGWACWCLGFPFMSRHTKESLKKHPEAKGKDIETTRKACERFKHKPITIISFAEGTRFTETKKVQRNSSFQHLLKPKAGGVAFVMAAMSEYLHTILDVTIIYPQGVTSFMGFLSGKLRNVIVHVKLQEITADLIGDYQYDDQFRIHFQRMMNQLWQEKDTLISQTLLQETSDANNIADSDSNQHSGHTPN